jgi:multicomponent Na+:H+ antiporter subunit C
MELLLSIITGVLYGTGIYMTLRRNAVKLIIGLVLISHGSNLLIFTSGGLNRGKPPIVEEESANLGDVADPLPQALVLTAIVIGFGVQAFCVVLVHRAAEVTRVPDTDHPDFRNI